MFSWCEIVMSISGVMISIFLIDNMGGRVLVTSAPLHVLVGVQTFVLEEKIAAEVGRNSTMAAGRSKE